MEFTYGIDQSNPGYSQARAAAQRRAMWASFGYFLERADGFILHYWPPSKRVEPLLAMGFEPQPTYVSPKARCLQGALTPDIRQLLWGPGQGAVPWWRVELTRDGEMIYFVEEHEDTAGWNGDARTLQELYAAGVDPSVVINSAEYRATWEPVTRGLEQLALAVAGVLAPGKGHGYGFAGEGSGPDALGYANLTAADGALIWLEYERQALGRIDRRTVAKGLLERLDPPVASGDLLRLVIVNDALRLTREARGLEPWRRGETHTLSQPDRAEWLRAVELLGHRADRFIFLWTEEPPASNGWRSDYGRERLLPFVTAAGPTDLPVNVRQMVGPVTPDLLAVIAGEPPHGLTNPDPVGPWALSPGRSPSPWWWFVLASGQEVLLESKGNGAVIGLRLTPEEAAALDPKDGRLHDHALARRQGQTWLALSRAVEKRVGDRVQWRVVDAAPVIKKP